MKPYRKIVNTSSLSREQWLKERKKGIGGSDIGTLMGFNQYSSPFMVYIDKTTDYNKDLSDNEAVYWGTTLEDVVAKEFERRSGKKVRRLNALLQSTETEFALANVDRLIVGEDAGLECKTTNAFNASEWSDEEIPASYICQCQWYMYVTGYKRWYIACLIGGQKFVYKPIERDEELIQYMLNTATEFWENNVKKNEPPPMDGSDACTEYIKENYSESNGESVCLPPSVETLVDDLNERKNLLKELTRQIKDLENRIKQYLGENEYAEGDRYCVKWKIQRSFVLDKEKIEERFPGATNLKKVQTCRKFSLKTKGDK